MILMVVSTWGILPNHIDDNTRTAKKKLNITSKATAYGLTESRDWKEEND